MTENTDIFEDFSFANFSDCMNNSIFPSLLKLANLTPVYKRLQKRQMFLKYSKDSCLSKSQDILKVFSLNINAELEKVSVSTIAWYQ